MIEIHKLCLCSHRHRKTEQEEDEELLAETNSSRRTIISFDQSPHYVKNGEMRDYQVSVQCFLMHKEVLSHSWNSVFIDPMFFHRCEGSIGWFRCMKMASMESLLMRWVLVKHCRQYHYLGKICNFILYTCDSLLKCL